MEQIFKRTMCLILTLVMVVGLLPVSAISAEAEETMEIVEETTEATTEAPSEESEATTEGPTESENGETEAPTEEETEPMSEESDVPDEDETVPENLVIPEEPALAAVVSSGTCGDNLTWTLDDSGKLTIDGTGPMERFSTSAPWAEYREKITAVVVCPGVTTVSGSAFEYCTNLVSVTLHEGLTELEAGLFRGCKSLTNIQIPSKVTEIGFFCFFQCDSLKEIVLPSRLTWLRQDCFRYCKSLTSITIPASVNQIGPGVFTGCTSLKEIIVEEGNSEFSSLDGVLYTRDQRTLLVYPGGKPGAFTIPDTVAMLEDGCFEDCEALTEIVIPARVEIIPDSCFSDCKGLTKVTIEDGITELGSYAFGWTWALESITIPASVEKLGYRCLAYSDLEEITFLGTAPEIGTECFDQLKAIVYYPPDDQYNWTADVMQDYGGSITWLPIGTEPEPEEGDWTWSLDANGTLTIRGTGAVPNYAQSSDTPWYAQNQTIRKVVVESGITQLGSRSFSNCFQLSQVSLADTVKIVGDSAFANCSEITKIYIPGVTRLGSSSFHGCMKLTGIYLPNSLAEIGAYCFYQCEKLTGVVLPKGLKSIGESCFALCDGITTISLPGSLTYIGSDCFFGCEELKSLTIGEGITSLPAGCFSACTGLTAVILPKSVTTLGDQCFESCLNLREINLPLSVTSLGNRCFYSCQRLSAITFPDTLTSLGAECFYGCSSLTGVTIGKGIKALPESCFRSCSGLTKVTLPDSVASLGENCFTGCTSLTEVTIGKGIKALPESCFRSCSGLTKVTLPDSVTGLGENCFTGCKKLSRIEFPTRLSSLGAECFSSCTGLREIVFRGESASIGKDSFSDVTATVWYPWTFRKSWTNLAENYGGSLLWLAYDTTPGQEVTGKEDIDPIIILPGIMGSRLFTSSTEFNKDTKVWDPAHTLSGMQKLQDHVTGTLYVRPPENAHNYSDEGTDAAYGREYGPFDGEEYVYKNLVDTLCEMFPDRPVYFFSYDWRKSNEENVAKLRDFVNSLATRVDFVCHSMGGLVASSYYAQFASEDRLDKIITCGTPYEGAPIILNVVQNWDVLGEGVFGENTVSDFCLGAFAGLTKSVKASFDGVAELLPTKNYISRTPMWQDSKWPFGMDDYQLTYSQYKDYCNEIFGTGRYSSAVKFQQSLHASSGSNKGYNALLGYDKSYFCIGINQKTITAVKFQYSGNDIDQRLYESDLEYDIWGDNSVPYLSASIFERVKNLPSGRYKTFDTTHQGVAREDASIRWVCDILKDGKSTVAGASLKNNSYIVVRVACPVDITITSGGQTLCSSADGFDALTSFGRLDILGENDEIKLLCLDYSPDYDIIINGTDTGSMDYAIRYFDASGQLQQEYVAEDVPVTDDTVIHTGSDVSEEGLVLEIDADGDGTVDETVEPCIREQYAAIVTVTAEFGGQAAGSGIYLLGDNVQVIAEPSEGYELVGWYDESDTCLSTELSYSFAAERDITLHARWAKKIYDKTEADTDITVEILNISQLTYTGKPIKPEIIVRDGGKILVAGTDYTVTYKNNTNACDHTDSSIKASKLPQILVQGKGNYKNAKKITVPFTIYPANLADLSVKVPTVVGVKEKDKRQTLTAEVRTEAAKVSAKAYTLRYFTDGDLANEVDGLTAAGTYYVVVEAVEGGNLRGATGAIPVVVVPKSQMLSSAKLTAQKNIQATADILEEKAAIQAVLSKLVVNKVTYLTDEDNISEFVELFAVTAKDSNGKPVELGKVLNSAGKKTITVTAREGNAAQLVGEKSLAITVKGIPLSKKQFTLENLKLEYNGEAQQPAITTELVPGTDYTVSFLRGKTEVKEPIDAGSYSLIITGQGLYSGKLTYKFTIASLDLNKAFEAGLLSIAHAGTATYSPSKAEVPVSLAYNGQTLAEGEDYILKFSGNTKVTDSASFTVTGKGNFKGTLNGLPELTYAITPKAIASQDVVVNVTGMTIKKGTVTAVKFTLKDSGKTVSAKEYTSEIQEVADQVQLTITGADLNYTGTRTLLLDKILTKTTSKQVKIARADTDKLYYTGSPIRPAITITDPDGSDISDCFTITYGENTNVGVGTITVTGNPEMGYYGAKTLKFTILPKWLKWLFG